MGYLAVGLAGAVVVLLAVWLVSERGRLLLPSSRKALREVGLRSLFTLRTLHAYVYGRWSRQYINLMINWLLPRLGPRGGKWWSDRYHGKVIRHEEAKAIITVDRKIPLQDLEQIVPYPAARSLVLGGPPDVAVLECPCRVARENPCEPIDVCLIVGQPFVDFLLEHHPRISRRLTQAEALELLHAEYQRGHLHSAWFKDACLDRFFAICNCCKCCCGGVDAMVNYGIPMLAPSGYTARVDPDQCNACGACKDACPFGAIQLNDTALIDRDACLGCGVCAGQCPQEAVSLERAPDKGIPLDVRLLGGNGVSDHIQSRKPLTP